MKNKDILSYIKDTLNDVKDTVCDIFRKIGNRISELKNMQIKSDTKSGKNISKYIFLGICVVILLVISIVVTFVSNKVSKINFAPADYMSVTDVLDEDILLEEQELIDSVAGMISDSDEDIGLDVENLGGATSVDTIRQDENIFNILIIGTDGEAMGRSRADSIIIASIDKKTYTIKLTSLMRDTYVSIPDYQGKSFGSQKITHAFFYGGAQLMINTIEENFGINIDNYVRVNFTVVAKLVDAVGGIPMELTSAEARFMNDKARVGEYKADLKKGSNWLNGRQALMFARIRTIDSDYYRTLRQQKVITTMLSRLKKCSVSELNEFINTAMSMVQTDMDRDLIYSFAADAASYFGNLSKMEQLTIPMPKTYSGKIINGSYVIVINKEKNLPKLYEFIYGETE